MHSRINLVRPPKELRVALAEVRRLFPERFADDAEGALALRFRRVAEPARNVRLRLDPRGGATLIYADRARALRGLGRLMGRLAGGHAPEDFSETAAFELAGVQLDCSRNAVPLEATVREWLLRAALMGLDAFLLYTEDTYRIPGEPFFGLARGGFSRGEIKRLDDFAFACGVEMIPCIQTLGHMEQALRWDCYRHLRDQLHTLLIDDEGTYALIEKMIDAASGPLRSRRIHICMDEAHGVGEGRYKALHGDAGTEINPAELMTRHLRRVRDLCAKRGLTPWMWSDMFFRLGSKTKDYYDRDAVLDPKAVKAIPGDVRPVYWDYYHTDEESYRVFLKRHRELGREPIMATGAWTWSCFWPFQRHALATLQPALAAARAEGVRDIFHTVWGDDGSECDFDAAWASLQFYAERIYAADPDDLRVAEGFRGAVGGDWADWLAVADMDQPPGLPTTPAEKIDPVYQRMLLTDVANPTKWLLWQDPMLSFLDPNIDPEAMAAFYAGEAERLAKLARKDLSSRRIGIPAKLAAALAKKAPLRARAARMIDRNDRAGMRRFLRNELPAAVRAVRTLWRAHRALWLERRRPEGWDAIERRYGGLMARLDTMDLRLRGWLEQDAPVPEFTERYPAAPPALAGELRFRLSYSLVATASVIR